ncbi:hypothetical protein [Christensenella intestinihominis]|nr:hypothetical protein [Christensenella intestinihominis]
MTTCYNVDIKGTEKDLRSPGEGVPRETTRGRPKAWHGEGVPD